MSNSNSNSSSVLDEKLALVSISLSCFAGYRRATRDHITQLGGTLPASGAITEGSIKVFPVEPLRVFQKIRRALFRRIGSMGVKALGSSTVFAIPSSKLAEAEKVISDADAEVAAERSSLDANYETLFEDHVKANVEAEAIIRSLKVDRGNAVSKICFNHNVFRIVPVVREGEDPAKGVASIVECLARQLFEEVSTAMVETAKSDTFVKADKASQKTLRPFKAELEKMRGLAFLDPLIEGAIHLVEETLAALPKDGYLVGQDFERIRRLIEIMSDTEDLVNAASRVSNGIDVNDVLFPPAPQSPTVQAVQAAVAVATVPTTSVPRPLPAMSFPGGMSAGVSSLPAGMPPLPIAPPKVQMVAPQAISLF